MTVKVSIIVLAYDNPIYLMKTVETLLEHTDYPDFEVIISDNSAGTRVEDDIREFCWTTETGYENVVYVKNEENLLHAKGCMAGFEKADSESEFICLCNDDIFIPRTQFDWLDKLVEQMIDNPKIATITPSTYSEKEAIYWVGKQNPENPQHDFLHLLKGDPRIPTEPILTSYNNMAVCLTRRILLEEIPLGQSCPHYGSDSEFANRIKDKYPEMIHVVDPRIKLYHYNIYYARENRGKDKRVEG